MPPPRPHSGPEVASDDIDRVFVGVLTLGILRFVYDRILRTIAIHVLHKYGAKV